MCNFTYSQGKLGLEKLGDADWRALREALARQRHETVREDGNPTDLINVLRFNGSTYKSEYLRFGLIPHWFQPDRHRKTINTQARSETVEELPSFRDSFRDHRCIVVIDGFYEWTEQRVKTAISGEDGNPLLIAGIWDCWTSPEGEVIESVAMVTTEATEWMMPFQDRQPLFLEPEEVPTWVEGSLNDARSLLRTSQIRLKANPPLDNGSLF